MKRSITHVMRLSVEGRWLETRSKNGLREQRKDAALRFLWSFGDRLGLKVLSEKPDLMFFKFCSCCNEVSLELSLKSPSLDVSRRRKDEAYKLLSNRNKASHIFYFGLEACFKYYNIFFKYLNVTPISITVLFFYRKTCSNFFL